jgi:hypothetical protein
MEKYCISCGMPLKNKEDIGCEVDKGTVCNYCINEDGSVKNCIEVFDSGVEFFMHSVPGIDKDLAERITRKNMKGQPLWQDANEKCLEGQSATDEEFQVVLDKLHDELAKKAKK